MKQISYFIYLELIILIAGSLLSNQNKIEIFLSSLIPFLVYGIESYLYLNSKKTNPLQSTRILIFGFIFKMAFFGPFLLGFIYFYAFNTRIFVFSFLCSIILFHTLEAMIIGSLFKLKDNKV